MQFHLYNKSFEKLLRVLAKTMLSDFEEKYYMPPEVWLSNFTNQENILGIKSYLQEVS